MRQIKENIKHKGIGILAFALAALTCAGQTPPAGHFRFQSADVPGAIETEVQGFNNLGQIVGAFKDESGSFRGFMKDGDQIVKVEVPNARFTAPECINNAGTIAGGYVDSARVTHGFTLKNGMITTIDPPGSTFTAIYSINDRGDMVGTYRTADSVFHGFLLDRNGFTTYDFPASPAQATSTSASAINNLATIVGAFEGEKSNIHGFFLSKKLFRQIDIPGALSTFTQGLNDAGDMVGVYLDKDNAAHGYLQRGTQLLTVDFTEGVTTLFQINAAGTILGYWTDDAGKDHSFTATQEPGDPLGGHTNQSLSTVKRGAGRQCSLSDWMRNPEQVGSLKGCKLD